MTTHASDTFTRSLSDSWGDADVGGTYTVTEGSATDFDVNGSKGTILNGGTNQGKQIALNSVSALDVDMTVAVDLNKDPTGTGGYVGAFLQARRIDNNGLYNGRIRFNAGGSVEVSIQRVVSGSFVTLVDWTAVSGTFSFGSPWWLRFQAEGASPTDLRVKAWPVGGGEPGSWDITTTDSSAALQVANAIGMQHYNSSALTNAPVVSIWDDLGVVDFAAVDESVDVVLLGGL